MSNVNLPGVEVLTNILNDKTGRSYTSSQLEFDVPTPLVPAVDNLDTDARNTSIRILANDGARYDLHYNRLRFSRLFEDRNLSFVHDDTTQTRLTHLLAGVNQRFNVLIEPEDIVDAPIVNPTYPLTVAIQAATNSLRFTHALSLTLTGENGEPPVEPEVLEPQFNMTAPAVFLNPDGDIASYDPWSGNFADPSFFTLFENDEFIVIMRLYNALNGPEESNNGNAWAVPDSNTTMTLGLHSKTGSAVDRFDGATLINSCLAAFSPPGPAYALVKQAADPDEGIPEDRLMINVPGAGMLPAQYVSDDSTTVIFDLSLPLSASGIPVTFGLKWTANGSQVQFTYEAIEKPKARFNQDCHPMFLDPADSYQMRPVGVSTGYSNGWATLDSEVMVQAGLYSGDLGNHVCSGYNGGYGAAELRNTYGANWALDIFIGTKLRDGESNAQAFDRLVGTGFEFNDDQGVNLSAALAADDSGFYVSAGEMLVRGTIPSTNPDRVVVHFRFGPDAVQSLFGHTERDYTFYVSPPDSNNLALRVVVENADDSAERGNASYLAGASTGQANHRQVVDLGDLPYLNAAQLNNDNAPYSVNDEGRRTATLLGNNGVMWAVTDVNDNRDGMGYMQIRQSYNNGRTWRVIGEIKPEFSNEYWSTPLSLAQFEGRIYVAFMNTDLDAGTQSFGLVYFSTETLTTRTGGVFRVENPQAYPVGYPNTPRSIGELATNGTSLVYVQGHYESGSGIAMTGVTVFDQYLNASKYQLTNPLSDKADNTLDFNGGVALFGGVLHLVLGGAQYTTTNIFNSRPQAVHLSYTVSGSELTAQPARWLATDINEAGLNYIGQPGGFQLQKWLFMSSFETSREDSANTTFGDFYVLDMEKPNAKWFRFLSNSKICGAPAPHVVAEGDRGIVFGYLYNSGAHSFGGFELPMTIKPNSTVDVVHFNDDSDLLKYDRNTRVINSNFLQDIYLEADQGGGDGPGPDPDPDAGNARFFVTNYQRAATTNDMRTFQAVETPETPYLYSGNVISGDDGVGYTFENDQAGGLTVRVSRDSGGNWARFTVPGFNVVGSQAVHFKGRVYVGLQRTDLVGFEGLQNAQSGLYLLEDTGTSISFKEVLTLPTWTQAIFVAAGRGSIYVYATRADGIFHSTDAETWQVEPIETNARLNAFGEVIGMAVDTTGVDILHFLTTNRDGSDLSKAFVHAWHYLPNGASMWNLTETNPFVSEMPNQDYVQGLTKENIAVKALDGRFLVAIGDFRQSNNQTGEFNIDQMGMLLLKDVRTPAEFTIVARNTGIRMPKIAENGNRTVVYGMNDGYGSPGGDHWMMHGDMQFSNWEFDTDTNSIFGINREESTFVLPILREPATVVYNPNLTPEDFQEVFGSMGATQVWNPEYTPRRLVTGPDGKVYAFAAAGTNTTKLTRWNADGTQDTSFSVNLAGGGLTGSEAVLGIAFDGADFLYIGGTFTSVNGDTTRRVLARLFANTGALDVNFPAVSIQQANNSNSTLRDIVFTDDHLFIAGPFAKINGTDKARFAKFTRAGVLVNEFTVPTDVLAVNPARMWVSPMGTILTAGDNTTPFRSFYPETGELAVTYDTNIRVADVLFDTDESFMALVSKSSVPQVSKYNLLSGAKEEGWGITFRLPTTGESRTIVLGSLIKIANDRFMACGMFNTAQSIYDTNPWTVGAMVTFDSIGQIMNGNRPNGFDGLYITRTVNAIAKPAQPAENRPLLFIAGNFGGVTRNHFPRLNPVVRYGWMLGQLPLNVW